jgi:hypothetical protein
MNNQTTGVFFPFIFGETKEVKIETKIQYNEVVESMDFREFIDMVFSNIIVEDDQILFITDTGYKYLMFHEQDCCEGVEVDDIVGDLSDLIGSPILMAQECVSKASHNYKKEYDSFTWTFYKFATIKGYVDIKWFGGSNGYYSESVSIKQVR